MKVMWCFMYSEEKTGENYKEACELWREKERERGREREKSNDKNIYRCKFIVKSELYFKEPNCWN